MRQFRKIAASAAVLAGFALATFSPAAAQTAYDTQFVTSITYQNVGSGNATISVLFFPEGAGTPITHNLPSLAPNAGASLAVVNVAGLTAGFKGGAVIQSDQLIVSTLVQVPVNSPGVANRPLTNGFTTNDGAAEFQIPTVLKNAFDTNTRFSIQNVDTAAANITVKFVSAAPGNLGQVVHTENITNLPPNSVKYIDAGQVAQLGATFNGSAQITAVRADTSTPGRVVAAALELSTNGGNANGFEGSAGGAAGGASKVYMPSAICNAFGGQQSAYAVQNVDPPGGAGSQNANVKVTYLTRPADDPNAPLVQNTFNTTIPPGAKASIAGCATNVPQGHTGSAVIESTGAKIVAVGKVTGPAFTSAAPGLTSGASKLALPYVRWTTTQFVPGGRQLTSIAIQNIGTTDLAAGAVKVRYYDKNGALVGTHDLPAIPVNAKVNSNPYTIGAAGSEFGYYADGTFGGSAIIEGPAGSQLVALARVLSNTPAGQVGEDYNAIPVQ